MGERGTKLNDLAFKRDAAGAIINAGQSIVDILNTAVTDATWTAITLPATSGLGCKSILASMRDGSNWKLSHLSAGTRYKTIFGSITIDIAKENGERLFYAQSSGATGTLEVILLD